MEWVISPPYPHMFPFMYVFSTFFANTIGQITSLRLLHTAFCWNDLNPKPFRETTSYTILLKLFYFCPYSLRLARLLRRVLPTSRFVSTTNISMKCVVNWIPDGNLSLEIRNALRIENFVVRMIWLRYSQTSGVTNWFFFFPPLYRVRHPVYIRSCHVEHVLEDTFANISTQSIIYVHILVARFQKFVVLVVQYRNINLVLRIRCSRMRSSAQECAILILLWGGYE